MAVIHAHSPQAKGRVERLFKTLQDRLVKDLRLAGIATIEAANQFVEAWRPGYNRRFAVQPAQAADLHRPCPASRDLDRSLCLKTTRVMRRDWTVAHHGQLFQIETPIHTHAVLVEDHLDGTMRITQSQRYRSVKCGEKRRRRLIRTGFRNGAVHRPDDNEVFRDALRSLREPLINHATPSV